MTTVKEFRDLGVAFVYGDKFTMGGQGFAFYSDSRDCNFDDAIITSFVWRPLYTLPDNPKFKYERDFSQAEIKWRPLLDQSDSKVGEPTKPVFTQEMADIKVGFKLKFNHDINGKFKRLHDERYGWEDGDNLEVIHITKNHDGEVCFIVLNCQEDVLTTATIIDTSFFDTRTPKQKAVDDALELIGCTNEGEVAIHLGQVYDLWHK